MSDEGAQGQDEAIEQAARKFAEILKAMAEGGCGLREILETAVGAGEDDSNDSPETKARKEAIRWRAMTIFNS